MRTAEAWTNAYVRAVLELERICVPSPAVESRALMVSVLSPVVVDHRTVDGATRRRVMLRDGYVCQVCLTARGPWEIDHKLPVCRGGEHTDQNLWLLCRGCNQVKGDRTVEELHEYLRSIGLAEFAC